MTKFKHKNGGMTEVFTKVNINRLRADKNYTEVSENASKKQTKERQPVKVEEVVEKKPLQ